jgi:sugar lactone lactonase YvrE
VIIDANMALWNAYGVHGWPSFALIGADGNLVPIQNRFGTPVFVTSGEGKREALDAAIAAALKTARENGTLAAKRVAIKADAAVPSTSGLAFPGKVIAATKTGDAPGYVFVADSSHNRVLITSWPSESGACRLLWTIGSDDAGFADGAAAVARFHNPQGMAFDPRSRTLYVADTDNHAVRAIDVGALERTGASANAVRTIAGTGQQVYDWTGGKKGTEQGLSSPWDVCLSPDAGLLYVAMAGSHQLWTIDLSSGVTKVFAGSGVEDLIDGPLDKAALAQPSALSMTPDGSRLYFADSETSSVRFVDLKSGTVNTVIGHGLFDFGDVSNTFVRTRFQHCLGVAGAPRPTHPPYDLLVADTYNHKIKLVDMKTQRVRDVLGVGRMENAKLTGDAVLDEPGGVFWVNAPEGPAVLVADTNNHRLLMMDPDGKNWRELVIDGLAPPDDAAGPGTNSGVQANIAAAPGKALKLLLTPTLPPENEPNAEAPIGIRVWRVNASGPAAAVAQRTLRAAAFPVSIAVPANVVEAGSRLRVEMSFASCAHGEQAICTPGEAAWDVTLEAGDASEAQLKGE